MKTTFPFIMIVVSIGMYFLYMSPTMNEVKLLSAEKNQYTTVLEKSKELKTKRDAVLNDYTSIPQTDIDKLNKIMPETFNPILFVNDMNFMASKYGMVAKDYKFDEPVTENRDAIIYEQVQKPYKTIVVSFGLSGQYAKFKQFVNDVESSLRLMDIVSLSIKPAGEDKFGDNLNYTLEINTYSLR